MAGAERVAAMRCTPHRERCRPPARCPVKGFAMTDNTTDDTTETPSRREIDRQNDNRFLTPLLLMALVMVGGILIYLMLGPPPVS
jgi:hypothetical protein